MLTEFFRWNQPAGDLHQFDGYFLPGGFSYEDRVRSGAIAARDPLMAVVAEEAAKAKPVIGICNGAQILVEAGLIPGLNANHLGSALTWNERGYLNIWVRIKNTALFGRSAFNNFDENLHFSLPIAHGEGRFVVPEKLLSQLIDNHQTIFRYCNEQGEIKDNYPVNPNGAVYNLAGVCNPAGNILALMPHPERTEAGLAIFKSMKKYLDSRSKTEDISLQELDYETPELELPAYRKPAQALEILVDLIITDNEAQTLQTALRELGFGPVKVKRFTHYEVGLVGSSIDRTSLSDDLVKSGVLLNTNKEIPYISDRSKLQTDWHSVLVRYQEDFEGQSKFNTLKNRLGIIEISDVKTGVVWQLSCNEKTWQKILQSHILFNPYSQRAYLLI